MDPRQVVILLEVFSDQLPVRLDVERLLVHSRPRVEVVPSHPIGKVAEPVKERRRVVGETGKEQHAPRVDADGEQAEFRLVEVVARHFVEERRRLQRAVQRVAPPVIGAADRAGDIAVGLGQFGAAVPTRVDEATEVACVIAGQEDRLGADLANEHPPSNGLVGDSDADPGLAEDTTLFHKIELIARVGSRIEARRSTHWAARPHP